MCDFRQNRDQERGEFSEAFDARFSGNSTKAKHERCVLKRHVKDAVVCLLCGHHPNVNLPGVDIVRDCDLVKGRGEPHRVLASFSI